MRPSRWVAGLAVGVAVTVLGSTSAWATDGAGPQVAASATPTPSPTPGPTPAPAPTPAPTPPRTPPPAAPKPPTPTAKPTQKHKTPPHKTPSHKTAAHKAPPHSAPPRRAQKHEHHKAPKRHSAHPAKGSGKKAKRPKTTVPPPPPVPQAHTPAQGPHYPIWGADVSIWQHPSNTEPLDWQALTGASPGYRFTFVKGSEGGIKNTNPWLRRDLTAAAQTGSYTGVYHYAVPSLPVRSSALTQARQAIAAAGPTHSGDLPLVLDFEANPRHLTPDELAQWALTWLATVAKQTGRTPILYTFPAFFSEHVTADPAFTGYPLWIAHYGLDLTAPTVPAPWSTWTFWQFSSEGHLPGTYGNLDMSVFAGSRAELALLAGARYHGRGVDASGVSMLGDAMLSAFDPTVPTG